VSFPWCLLLIRPSPITNLGNWQRR
jgi:hypothetical protein